MVTRGGKRVNTNHDCCWDKFTMITPGKKAAETPTPGRVACEQGLRGALAAGQEKVGELATTSLEFEFHLQYSPGSLSTELSRFRQSA